MDIALIDPATNECVNVIVADSLAHAETLFPAMLCVERKTAPLEPGAFIIGKDIKRAHEVTDEDKTNAKATELKKDEL